MSRLLDPGFNLTLRPMRYPKFYEMYRAAIKNTWSVEEIDFQIDLSHMQHRMSAADRHLIEMRQYLQYVADQRLLKLNLPAIYHSRNPFAFMELQDVQEVTNFFERKVSAYQVAIQGEVAFDHAF
jgi:ribonucleotide reductase beta subunit family protein with ferritin-like domain